MKTKLPMFHLIFLILLMVGAGFLFYRTENNIKATRKLQLEVSRQETNISKLGDLSVLLPTLTSETSTYLRTLPMSESDVAAYATLVETLAKDSDLTIANHFDDFPKARDVSGKNILGLGMEITLEGPFQGLTRFFARLTALPYYFKIDKITILNQETKTGVKAIVNGSLMMNTEKK